MNADRHAKLYEVFCGAAALSGSDRSAYLDKACANEPALRAEVERLLERDPGLPSPSHVGHFAIRGKLGEGGMGVVYLAQREHHPRDFVALKVIRSGMNSKEVLVRFEAEQKALTLLNHPNIARLFEVGVTSDGLPYFTMEYVPGVAITEFCDANRLSVQERLALFSEVCSAVEHAHQCGIMHRDIKPTNVLVAIRDKKPTSKIIDFGVAKALNFTLSERTLFTEQGRLVGTPEYMSPEQAGKTATEVDYRTDIYSLGILLYELLVGVPPIDGKTLREKAWEEMARTIREFEPAKPSTKRRTLTGNGKTDLNSRGTDIHVMHRLLREDLDQITLKAIEKKPVHRYQSAAQFADMIQRYLQGEPIPWRVSSRWGRAQRHMRWHRKAYLRTVVGAVGLAVVSVIAYQINLSRRVSALVEQASKCAQAGVEDWDCCIHAAGEALSLEPQQSRALYADAYCRYKRSERLCDRERQYNTDLHDALVVLDRYFAAGIHDKYEPLCWNLRSAILLEIGPSAFAEAKFANDRARALAPDNLGPHIYQAAILALSLNFTGALEASRIGGTLETKTAKDSFSDRRRYIDADEIWRLVGTIQLHLGKFGEAKEALDHTMSKDNIDHRNSVILARYYLACNPPNNKEALKLAMGQSTYHIPYYDRVLALAYLRNEEWADAIKSAGDERFGPEPVPSFRYLIVAIAAARLNDFERAENALARAVAPDVWPHDLQASKTTVVFKNGFLWIESYEELTGLREEAEREIQAARLRDANR